MNQVKKLVVKVGTSTLTHENGRLDLLHIDKLVRAIADVSGTGVHTLLVSSGAIAVGVSSLGLDKRPTDIPGRQATAAVDQTRLMHVYEKMFDEYGYRVGQILLSHDVLDKPDWLFNVQNTVNRLFEYNVIPIANENDTVAVDDIKIENDTLSATVAVITKADLLVLATHPDDELIFFGGTIPTYAVEREKSVVVAYMSGASAARRSELLNGLWHMGVRQYPVIGPFGDVYSTNMAVIYDQWGRERVRKYVMGLIRRYKPDVVVTHDRGGEYGHGAHKVTADASVYCVENAANPSVLPTLCEAYGAWTVKKLYLHMGEENVIRMDWNVPLSAMGGKTGEQLAQEAFLLHVTQQKTRYVVTDEGKTGNAKFSLVYTTVGPDIVGGDFFENVE